MQKTIERVSPILVTLTSRSDSDFELRTSASKKIDQIVLIWTLLVLTIAFERAKKKQYGFQQTGLIELVLLYFIGKYETVLGFTEQ